MTFYLQASYQGDELVLDNYGLFTLPDRPVTKDEKALFDNISNLVRNSPRPFQKVVTNHVKSALVATLDVIVKEKEAGKAVAKCGFLQQFVCFYLIIYQNQKYSSLLYFRLELKIRKSQKENGKSETPPNTY